MLHDDGSNLLTAHALTPMEIYLEMARRLEQGGRAAMATIIKAKGSTPQQLGAKMVVFDDGSFIGTVGGGCVEADIWAECREVMRTGRAGIFHFNLGGDYEEAEGMVCGGQMDVMIEPWSLEDRSQNLSHHLSIEAE